jgi:cytoskeletal protein CcmA (bactofilin family)
MFSKTSDPISAPSSRPSGGSSSGGVKSILSSDLRVTGELSTSGAIEVLGEVDGNVTADTLVIGAEGRVSGTVKAANVEVKGRLDGKVETQSFSMRAAAIVAADVTYGAIVIESGAQIEGQFAHNKG